MARVMLGGGMFFLEAVSGGLSSASHGGWLTPIAMALMAVTTLPTACAIANRLFNGAPSAADGAAET